MAGAGDPTVHQLRILLTLAEELHFGRAAAKLFLTQPALSQQIRSLESRLGIKLFKRTSRHVEITPVGRRLLPLAKDIVNAMDDLHEAARQPTDGLDRLRLGVFEGATVLPCTQRVINAITTLYPGLDLAIRVVDFVEQATVLAEGGVDVMLTYQPVLDELRTHRLSTEPRVLCISIADELAERSAVSLAELAGQPVVGMAPDVPRAWRDFWAADPRPDDTPVPYTTHGVTNMESLLSAVIYDRAIAFVPDSAREFFPRPRVRYIPVPELSPCEFSVVWPARRVTPQAAAVEDILRNHLCHEDIGACPGQRPSPEDDQLWHDSWAR